MAVDPVPSCLTGVQELSWSTWASLLTMVRQFGEELVALQPSVVEGSRRLSDFEYPFEQRLIGGLRDHLGDISVLAEEYFNHHGRIIPGTRPMQILIDPLDGSRSYASGSDRYAIVITGVVRGEPLFAIVHQPAGDHTYTAVRGAGAFLDSARIVPSGSVPRSVAMRLSPKVPADVHPVADRLRRLGYTVERLESTALKLCWIGSGRYAGLVKPVTRRAGVLCTWALTAGLLVAGELGIAARTLDARPWRPQEGLIAVGDHRFFDDIRPGTW